MKCTHICLLLFCGTFLISGLSTSCSPGCIGECISNGHCECKPGWYGESCSHVYEYDCYNKTNNGSTFNGRVNVSEDGACSNWKTVNSTYAQYYEDHSYCRHPNSSYNDVNSIPKPWCYTLFVYRTKLYEYNTCNIRACECGPGKYGTKCDLQCHCSKPGCDVSTGICFEGVCQERWTGKSCNVCVNGYWGDDCEKGCHCKTGGCNKSTGVCSNGECADGWTGNVCDQCLPERFGDSCENNCHCLSGKCSNSTGYCTTRGCKAGWTGLSCNDTCPKGYFGENCENQCHCAVNSCEVVTGICKNMSAGCKVPWTEQNCSLPIQCPRFSKSVSVFVSPEKSVYIYNEMVRLSCKPGYDGTSVTATCQADKTWTSNRPICSRITCRKPKVSCRLFWTPNKTIYDKNDIAEFYCENGDQLYGSRYLKCVSLNKWDKGIPECVPSVTSNPNGVSYEAFGGTIAGFLILFLLAIGIMIHIIKRYRTALYKSDKTYEDLARRSGTSRNEDVAQVYNEITETTS